MEAISVISAISLGAFVATTPAAFAQDAAPEPEVKTQSYQQWTLRCVSAEDRKRCEINQVAIVTNAEKNTRQRIMTVSFTEDASGAEILRLVLPLGTNIGRGVSFNVSPDLTLNNLQFSYCLQDGCLIEIPVNAGLLGEMRSGGEASVNIYLLNSANETTLPVNFTGFNEAYEAFLTE